VKRTIDTRFWTFSQNNSGGSFVESEALSHFVIIEAVNAEDANRRAEDIGIYFDGVDAGVDCECCGDRWYRQWESAEGTESPQVYGESAFTYLDMFCDEPVRIHYLDGRVEKAGKLRGSK
jgi:hypothetical protein